MKHTEALPPLIAEYLRQLAARADQISELSRFAEALRRENQRNNLISRGDSGNIWPRHILHSIMPLLICAMPRGLKVVDIGSGGGLPGIPMAILRPDYHLFLVDSIRKKTESLKRIVAAIGLSNVTVVNRRVEEMGADSSFLGSVDLCMARAVAPLRKLAEWSAPLLRKDRTFEPPFGAEGKVIIGKPALVSLKGGDLTEELDQTRRSFPQASIEVYPLENNMLEEKKIVIVYM